jgi:NDP-sugar pyrophosphorylase family protein
MKAMVLAAGLGTRLRPLTDACPKALMRIGGRTLLEIALCRLRSFGVTDVMVNVHHCADMMVDYLQSNHNFGMNIEVSREDVLLDTGGGLRRAAHFFLSDGRSEQPFILHNVDVISTIDLTRMVRFHLENHALATLAVQKRESSRYLLFDEALQLCGRTSGRDMDPEMLRTAGKVQPLAFCGVHVISPRLLEMMPEEGVFSIIPVYLNLARQGERVVAFRADDCYWRDLGRLDHLQQAELDIKAGAITL